MIRSGELPLGLGGTVLLVQVAVGLILFATFQEYVPNALDTGDALPGLLVTAYGGARFLFEGPTGALTDRIERKLGLLLGFAIMAVAVALMATVREPTAYVVFAAMLGIGNAFLWPAAYAISAEVYPATRRGRTSGILNVAQLIGFGIGALLGALVVESLPQMQFVIAGAAIGLAFILVLRVIPAFRGGRLFAVRAREKQQASIWSVMSLRVAGMVGLVLAASSSQAMLLPAIRPFGEEQLEVSFATLTLAMGPAALMGAAAYIPAGIVADRVGRVYPFLSGQLMVCVALVALSFVTRIEIAAVLVIFVFCGYTMSIPAWSAAVMDLAPASHRGAVIGLSVAASGLGIAIGPAIGGVVTELQDAVVTLRTAAALSLATGAAIWMYWRAFGDGRVEELDEPSIAAP